jgi:hypothetical protein
VSATDDHTQAFRHGGACSFGENQMRTLAALVLTTLSLAAFPIAGTAFADSRTDKLCGPDGPEAYKRPGGYCEQIGAGSLLKGAEGCTSYDYPQSIAALKQDEVILVAENCVFVDGPEDQ